MRRSRLSHVDDDRPQRTQVTAVINASDFSPRFLLELTTGVRRGQVCGLKWSAVDLEGGQITLHDNRVVVGGKVLDKAGGKTRNADKTISLDGVTLAELREWREQQDREREFFGSDYHPGDFVFTYQDGRSRAECPQHFALDQSLTNIVVMQAIPLSSRSWGHRRSIPVLRGELGGEELDAFGLTFGA